MAMRNRGITAIALATGLLVAAMPQAFAGSVALNSSDGSVNVPVKSFKELPFRTVVRQEFDNSCGSAAVATLLTYHFERPTTEHAAFVAMWEAGDQERIQREGFSLLEMKLYLENLGYKADGFKVTLEKVKSVGVPVIVLIETNGYKHFVVIKGVRNGRVMIGDPARGLLKMKEEKFMEVWKNGLVFAVHNADEIGRQHFDSDREWALMPSFDVANAVSRQSLQSFTVTLPSFNESLK
jgi:predicted double-glycine peptidase